MSDTKIDHSKKHPAFTAYHVRDGKQGEKGFWTRIGVAWCTRTARASTCSSTAWPRWTDASSSARRSRKTANRRINWAGRMARPQLERTRP